MYNITASEARRKILPQSEFLCGMRGKYKLFFDQHRETLIEAMSEAEICANAASTFVQNKKGFQHSFDEAKKSSKKDVRSGDITKHVMAGRNAVTGGS